MRAGRPPVPQGPGHCSRSGMKQRPIGAKWLPPDHTGLGEGPRGAQTPFYLWIIHTMGFSGGEDRVGRNLLTISSSLQKMWDSNATWLANLTGCQLRSQIYFKKEQEKSLAPFPTSQPDPGFHSPGKRKPEPNWKEKQNAKMSLGC